MSRSNDTDVHADCPGRSNGLELTFLQKAEQLGLYVKWQIAHFVNE